MLRVISTVLILLLMLSPISSIAASYSFDYTIGEQTYELSIDERDYYEFYLPFDSEYMEVKYNISEDSDIDIVINGYVFSSVAKSENTSFTINFSEVIRKGDCDFEWRCDGEITVSDVTFHKVKEKASYSGPENLTSDKRNVIEFTEYEDAVRTAVIINKNSPIIKVNGANRYINYDEPKETPYCENNIVYLPIHTFARAFGYYYECEDDYFLLRGDNVDFVLKNEKLYQQINKGKYTEITNNVLSKNNTIYIPVKYYAEASGKTVLIKDDYIIADQRDLAKIIISNDIFCYVQKEFKNFITEKTETVYYVSQSDYADDDNLGTYNAPFATLSKACEVADAGDRVIIDSGVYREILKPNNNGTADNPIIFEAADGANVKISALEEIGAPDYEENGLYVYNMDWDLGEGRNQVFYKKEALAEARHPNTNTSPRYYPEKLELSTLWPTQGNIQVTLDGVADTATSSTDLNQDEEYWKDATLVSLHGRGYGVATAKIVSSESGKLHLSEESTRLWHKEGGSDADNHYDFGYITNTINAVDVPGEWFWKDGKLYIYPLENSTVDTFQLEAKKRQITVDLTDREYIHVIGINTVGGGMKLNNSKMCVINGGTHQYISHFTYTDDTETGFIDTRDNINDLYDENAAPYRGEMGFYISGRDNAIINTNIEYSAAGALCLAGAYSYIENNLISECGYMGGGTNGIYLFSSPLEDITIVKGGHCLYNNTIDKTGRASLNLSSWTYPLDQKNGLVPWVACDIAYNDFLNSNINTRDNGSIYAYGSVLGDERKKLQFHHNVIGSSWASDGYGTGIYWDNYSQMIECYNNIIFYDTEKVENGKYLHIADINKYPDAFSYVDAWNNNNAGYLLLGKSGLSIDDYPLGEWFFSGCRDNEENAFDGVTNSVNSFIKSTEAVVLGSSVLFDESGGAHIKSSESEICFENVDFGNECFAIGVYYFGDRYNTGDKLFIAIGNNPSDEEYSEIQFECTAASKGDINEKIVSFDNIPDFGNVYIKGSDYRSAGVLGIRIIKKSDSINNKYALKITDDNDKYYLSGKSIRNSSLIATITGKDNKLYDANIGGVDENGKFSLSLNKAVYNGVYKLNIFCWENLDNIKPINPVCRYMFEESKYKEAFSRTKFKNADLYPDLISDGTTVCSYGKNDIIMFENVDFRSGIAKAISIKYGLDDTEIDKLTVKMYLDSIDTIPILTFSPCSTENRFSRETYVYNLYIDEDITGIHNVLFHIEGESSLPLHLEEMKFEYEFSESAENPSKNAFVENLFKNAEKVNLISDGTVACSYGKNDTIMFENVDFNNGVANSVLSSRLNIDYYNMGFSSSAMGELELADYFNTIEMSVFVYDYDHNAPDVEHLRKTHEPFFKRIREKNPDIPVIIMTRPGVKYTEEEKQRREVVKTTYENAVNSGDENVYFIDGETFYGTEERFRCTLDNIHPNDIGMLKMADTIEPILADILKNIK